MEIREAAVLPPDVVARRACAAEEHRRRLLALARGRGVSRDDAEDVVAEALLRALEFEDLNEDLLPNFLTTVTIRLCADLHARKSVAIRHQHRLTMPGEVAGPDEAVCDRAEAEWVAGMVAALPSRQRDVLQARAHGESCESIARRNRMTYKAVESTLSRARATIRTAFATTLGLSPFVVRPRRALGATAVAAASATGVALVIGPYVGREPVPHFPPPPEPPRVVELVEEEPSVEPTPMTSASASPSAEPSDGPETSGSDEAHDGPQATPTRTLASAGPVRVYTYRDGYTVAERATHCVEHGLDPKEHVCNYPPE